MLKTANSMYEVIEEEKKTGWDYVTGMLSSVGGFIFESIEAVVIALALSVVLYLFLFTPHEVMGRSMHPTYKNGEYLIANKIIYKLGEPQIGDVIIFKYSPTQDFIKRIIATEGDTVSIQDGRYVVNGELIDEEEYLENTVVTSGGAFLAEGQSITVPTDEVFVSGDNRPHSSDSRAFGPIPIEDIKGKVWVVYFPFNEFRFISNPEY
jgi:signal peptidase I